MNRNTYRFNKRFLSDVPTTLRDGTRYTRSALDRDLAKLDSHQLRLLYRALEEAAKHQYPLSAVPSSLTDDKVSLSLDDEFNEVMQDLEEAAQIQYGVPMQTVIDDATKAAAEEEFVELIQRPRYQFRGCNNKATVDDLNPKDDFGEPDFLFGDDINVV
jgi:hypothetical protein